MLELHLQPSTTVLSHRTTCFGLTRPSPHPCAPDNRTVTPHNMFRPHKAIATSLCPRQPYCHTAQHVSASRGHRHIPVHRATAALNPRNITLRKQSPVIYIETFNAVARTEGFSIQHFTLNKTVQDVVRHRQRQPKIIYV